MITIKDESVQSKSEPKKRFDLHDGLFLLGFALLETGTAQRFDLPAALILAGVICLVPFMTAAVASFRRALRRGE
jgi:hypothetical protein